MQGAQLSGLQIVGTQKMLVLTAFLLVRPLPGQSPRAPTSSACLQGQRRDHS